MNSLQISETYVSEVKKLQQQKRLCEKKIRDYEENIYQTKLLIQKIDSKINEACPKHNWENDREPGMYGDRFTYCTVCGYIM